MRIVTCSILLLLVFAGLTSRPQTDPLLIDPILIRLKGRIVSAADSSAVPYANIINNRTHTGTITNTEGYFTIEMLNIDSLLVTSVGYDKIVLKIPHNYNEQEIITFIMSPVTYLVNEVEVTGDKPKAAQGLGTGTPTDIPPQLRGDAFNEKPPALSALFNPVSYWQYYLSKKEKEKREVREAMKLQENWEMHSENYNLEMVKRLTGLNDLEADSFMVWFNSKNILPYTATEYEVRTSVVTWFNIYRREKNME